MEISFFRIAKNNTYRYLDETLRRDKEGKI